MCVIRLPCPYSSGEVSYITSHHVLGDIIQPAGVGLLQIITGTGVYFISPINALQSWYSTPPFDSFCFLYFPTSPSRHNKKAQGWRFPSACELSELSFKYFSQSNVFSWTLEERTILTGTKGEFFFFRFATAIEPECLLNWDVHPSLCALRTWRTAWAFSRISRSPCSHTI